MRNNICKSVDKYEHKKTLVDEEFMFHTPYEWQQD